MTVANELYALLPATEAQTAVADLERHGIHPDEIVVREVAPGRYPLHDEQLHEEATGARRGAELGALLGAVVGLVVASFVPVLRDAGVLGWVVTAFGGAGFGALVGAMTGLQLHSHDDDDPAGFADVTGDDPVRMVEVHCLHYHDRAHHLLEQHEHVRFLDAPEPVG